MSSQASASKVHTKKYLIARLDKNIHGLFMCNVKLRSIETIPVAILCVRFPTTERQYNSDLIVNSLPVLGDR